MDFSNLFKNLPSEAFQWIVKSFVKYRKRQLFPYGLWEQLIGFREVSSWIPINSFVETRRKTKHQVRSPAPPLFSVTPILSPMVWLNSGKEWSYTHKNPKISAVKWWNKRFINIVFRHFACHLRHWITESSSGTKNDLKWGQNVYLTFIFSRFVCFVLHVSLVYLEAESCYEAQVGL